MKSKKYPQLNNKNWLEQKYLEEKLSTKQIGELLNCSAVYVTTFIRYHRIPKIYKSPIELRDENWLYQKYVVDKFSAEKISKIINCSVWSVIHYLKQHKIHVRDLRESQLLIRPDKFINNQEIMDGLLIGDGCICKYEDSNPCLRICQINQDLVEYLRNNLCPQSNIFIIKGGKRYKKDGASFIAKDTYNTTCYSEQLFDYFNKWYIKNENLKIKRKYIKIIPLDLKLTPIMVKNWFMGDGNTTYKEYGISLSLHTNCFTLKEVEFLRDLFISQLNIDFNINFKGVNKYGENTYILITGKRNNIEKFYNYISFCEIPSMFYKWKKYS